MSYDVWIEVDYGHADGPQWINVLDKNYTWNVAPMFYHVVDSTPNDWDGKPAAEVAKIAMECLSEFGADPGLYKAMDPPNGWGSFEGATSFISSIYHACRKVPNGTFRCR